MPHKRMLNRLPTAGVLTIAIQLALITGAGADPAARQQAKDLGYSSEVTDLLADKHLPRAPRDPAYSETPPQEGGLKDIDTVKGFLTPKLYQKPEPSTLLPTLLNLQRRQPDSAKITRKLALTCLQAGQPRESLHWFVKTFQLDRNDFSALWNMATLAYRLGDYRQAADYFAEYARVDPNSAWGVMARQFQTADRFEARGLTSGFKNVMPKTGFVEASSGKSGGSALMVIDGRQTNTEEYLPIPITSKKAPATDMATGRRSGLPTAESFAGQPVKAPITKAVIETKAEKPAEAPVVQPPSPAPTPGPAATASAPAAPVPVPATASGPAPAK